MASRSDFYWGSNSSHKMKYTKKPSESLIRPRLAIVNGYTLIAIVYCFSFTIIFYAVVKNMFLAVIHGLALVSVLVSYIGFKKTGNLKKSTNIILFTGTVVVISLFATGGWENTGYLWPFAYLPFAFFLSDRKDTLYWVIALFAGCLIVVALNWLRVITWSYSPIALVNYFAALLIFITCLYLFQKATLQAENALRESEERFRLLIGGVKDHAIFMMDINGNVMSWNEGAERIKGYTEK